MATLTPLGNEVCPPSSEDDYLSPEIPATGSLVVGGFPWHNAIGDNPYAPTRENSASFHLDTALHGQFDPSHTPRAQTPGINPSGLTSVAVYPSLLDSGSQT